MAQVIDADVDVLRKGVAGEVLVAGQIGYDEARTVWNGGIDRRPAVIVRATNAADVSAAIGFARSRGLEIAVRGGAHSTAGASVVDDGLMIDLSLMNTTEVDPVSRRARVGGGATLAQRDTATQEHGLAAPAGIVGHTGVGGLTLTGGMGWLTRKHGLALDNVVSVEIVTADGAVRRASQEENADLFWAVRGGGGNFGVVTEFEFALHPVGPMVALGLQFWPLSQGPEFLRLARDVATSLPDEINIIIGAINAPPAPFVPPELQGTPGYALIVTGFGEPAEHEQVLARIRSALPPLVDFATPIPYAQLQQMFDEGNHFGLHAYDKATYLETLSDDALDVIAEHVARKSSPESALFVYRLDGAFAQVEDDATAFGGRRTPCFALFLLAIGEDAAQCEPDVAWVRDLWAALQPHAMGSGSYLNGESEFTEDRIRASYGAAKYDRLVEIKGRYDPDNVFRRNANIPPAATPPRQRTPQP
jgi:hypothetical protein